MKVKVPTDDATLTLADLLAEDQGHLDLIVKKYPNGPMSTHMHNMNPGQRLNFKGPLPKYPWSENKHDHIALIAGGTGITPYFLPHPPSF